MAKLTACEAKALLRLQAQELKEKKARARKREKKREQRQQTQSAPRGQVFPSMFGIQPSVPARQMEPQAMAQSTPAVSPFAQSLLNIGFGTAQALLQYHMMNRGQWNRDQQERVRRVVNEGNQTDPERAEFGAQFEGEEQFENEEDEDEEGDEEQQNQGGDDRPDDDQQGGGAGAGGGGGQGGGGGGNQNQNQGAGGGAGGGGGGGQGGNQGQGFGGGAGGGGGGGQGGGGNQGQNQGFGGGAGGGGGGGGQGGRGGRFFAQAPEDDDEDDDFKDAPEDDAENDDFKDPFTPPPRTVRKRWNESLGAWEEEERTAKRLNQSIPFSFGQQMDIPPPQDQMIFVPDPVYREWHGYSDERKKVFLDGMPRDKQLSYLRGYNNWLERNRRPADPNDPAFWDQTKVNVPLRQPAIPANPIFFERPSILPENPRELLNMIPEGRAPAPPVPGPIIPNMDALAERRERNRQRNEARVAQSEERKSRIQALLDQSQQLRLQFNEPIQALNEDESPRMSPYMTNAEYRNMQAVDQAFQTSTDLRRREEELMQTRNVIDNMRRQDMKSDDLVAQLNSQLKRAQDDAKEVDSLVSANQNADLIAAQAKKNKRVMFNKIDEDINIPLGTPTKQSALQPYDTFYARRTPGFHLGDRQDIYDWSNQQEDEEREKYAQSPLFGRSMALEMSNIPNMENATGVSSTGRVQYPRIPNPNFGGNEAPASLNPYAGSQSEASSSIGSLNIADNENWTEANAYNFDADISNPGRFDNPNVAAQYEATGETFFE